MTHRGSVWLHRFAILTAVATFLLIIAGALVVGHEAGLSVPDWPLSYGKWMPPMEGGVLYEHGHRMVAALVGTLTTVLAIWLWRVESRNWVRRLGFIAAVTVVAQAVLGGLTVLYLLPMPIVVGHACLAQTFFCLTLALALFTSPAWDRSEVRETAEEAFPAFRHIACIGTAAVFIQLVLGAARRHNALGLLPHVIWASVVTVVVLWLVFLGLNRLPHDQKAMRSLSSLAGLFLGLQLALGFGSYWTRSLTQGAPQPDWTMVLMTTAHVAVGALLLGTSLLLTLLAFRRLPSPARALSFNQSPQNTLA